MNGENELLGYMTKLHHMADYLARGEVLQSRDNATAIEIVDDEITRQRNVFSIQKYSLYDELELSFFGEQRSIGTLMEYIEEGAYEKQIAGKIDFGKPYIPESENAEFYRRTMKRVSAILKIMSLSLASGSRIPLEDYKFKGLLESHLDEEEISLYENEEDTSLMYSTAKQCFCVVNASGEIIIEDVNIDVAMDIYNHFLVEQEQEELAKRALKDVQKEEEKTEQEEKE